MLLNCKDCDSTSNYSVKSLQITPQFGYYTLLLVVGPRQGGPRLPLMKYFQITYIIYWFIYLIGYLTG